MSARTVLSFGATAIEVLVTALALIAGLVVLVVAELVGWVLRP
ncbi:MULTISPECIES: hypothetical protein [Gordonia]